MQFLVKNFPDSKNCPSSNAWMVGRFFWLCFTIGRFKLWPQQWQTQTQTQTYTQTQTQFLHWARLRNTQEFNWCNLLDTHAHTISEVGYTTIYAIQKLNVENNSMKWNFEKTTFIFIFKLCGFPPLGAFSIYNRWNLFDKSYFIP